MNKKDKEINEFLEKNKGSFEKLKKDKEFYDSIPMTDESKRLKFFSEIEAMVELNQKNFPKDKFSYKNIIQYYINKYEFLVNKQLKGKEK